MAAKSEGNISKLPKWAQEHIANLKRERDLSVRALHEFRDEQTESAVWYDDHVSSGEESGPTQYRKYLQTHGVSFKIGPKEQHIIDILFRKDEAQLQITAWHQMLFRPESGNSIRIVPGVSFGR